MPVIAPENREVCQLSGVHLFHSPYSNCSQRSRLVLEEKGVAWTSHKIDLMAFEHLTDAYQGIHPKGVVPALVHDGKLVVESHDIIRYLDEHFAGPRLMPRDAAEAARIRPWMELGDELQMSIKTLTYERIFRDRYPPTPDKLAFYAAHQRNPELVDFFRRFLEGFGAETLERSERAVSVFLDSVEAALGEGDWLVGEDFSLADVSAVVNVHRAGVLGFDLDRLARTSDWYARMRARPSFERAITQWVKAA